MEKLHWGIMSTASIARKHIIPAINKVENNKVKAIASRKKNKAEDLAATFNIEKVFDNYDQLINDKNLDIIYIPLPNTIHKKWVLKTLEKKKHILCEKPLGINATEIRKMIKKAKKEKMFLMEGFMYRYQPFIKKIKEVINKEIGDLRFLDINFCYKSSRPKDDIRFNKSLGGGSLYDVGCYTVDLARLLLNKKPTEVYNIFYKNNKNQVDHSGESILKFKNNITANLNYSFNSYSYKDFTAIGNKGKIVVKDFFEWFPDNGHTVELKTDKKNWIYAFKPKNPYVLEIKAIYNHLINEKELLEDLSASLDNMIIIDKLFESSNKNIPIKL